MNASGSACPSAQATDAMRVDTPSEGRSVTVGPWSSASRWIVLLLVASTVTWRAQNIFSGGLDAVVVAKAVLSCLALSLAYLARVHRGQGRPMGTFFVWLLLAFLVASTLGALANGTVMVTCVLIGRLLIVAFTIVLLVKTFPAEQLFRDVLTWMALIAVVAAVSGLPTYLAGGRLRGGMPELHMNELALLCAIPLVGLLALAMAGRARPMELVMLVGLFAILWATGSRTSLLVVIFAFVVLLTQTRRLGLMPFLVIVASVPVGYYLLFGTDLLVGFFNRGGPGEGDITTLNSRSIGWTAALDPDTEWARWLGTGMATKTVVVSGQYWEEQTLDSSWISAIVQAGWIGAAILALWVVVLLIKAARLPLTRSAFVLALLLSMLLRSILESGLVDSSPAFVVFLLITLASDPGPRASRRAVPAATPRPVRVTR